MGIDISQTHTVEVGYDEFCGALAARDLQPASLFRSNVAETGVYWRSPIPVSRAYRSPARHCGARCNTWDPANRPRPIATRPAPFASY